MNIYSGRHALKLLLGVPFILFANSLGGHLPGEESFEGPRELQPDVVAEERRIAQLSWSGKRKVDGVEVEWSPEGTILRSRNKKKILEEAELIRASLSKSPLLKDLAADVQPTNDDTVLDLRTLMSKIKARVDRSKCHVCFSLPMCFDGNIKPRFMESDDMYEHLRNGYIASPRANIGPGDMVSYRLNYLNNDPYHAYVWLSPLLGLEIRGHTEGPILIRPQKEIKDEYTELAKMERKAHRQAGNPVGRFSDSLLQEHWKRK